jgi:hypothetical protein
MHKSIVAIERMDQIIMELGSPVIHKDEYMRMIANDLDRSIEQVWRVKFHDDGKVDLYSFAMPQEKNLPDTHCLNAAALPQWVKERISVLQICDEGQSVEGVGQKLSDKVFYVIE